MTMTNLANTVLTLKGLSVKNLVRFDLIDSPAPDTLARALDDLYHLGALDDDCNLTKTGEIMSEFPLDPQMAKMLIVSPEFNCSNEILSVSAMLSGTPFTFIFLFLLPWVRYVVKGRRKLAGSFHSAYILMCIRSHLLSFMCIIVI